MRKTTILLLTGCFLFGGCEDKSSKQVNDESSIDAPQETIVKADCNIIINDIQFSKAINGADSLLKQEDYKTVSLRAGEGRDFFCDPNEKLTNNTAPILLTAVDNTQPFTFSARVKPEFMTTGVYNAGVLYIYINETFWQKFCFEQDERGNHRIVTVRTQGTSDDNNHDIVQQDYVYMKYVSDATTIASYYSLDGKEWQMVRLYKNNYPKQIYIGLSSQCPVDKGCVSYFSEIELTQKAVDDFRMGK